MKIVKIGTFDGHGNPTGWVIDGSGPTQHSEINFCLGILDGCVTINGVEIVEWTAVRKESMDNYTEVIPGYEPIVLPAELFEI